MKLEYNKLEMKLLDDFAGRVMQRKCNIPMTSTKELVEDAYRIAKAMIKERRKIIQENRDIFHERTSNKN